MNDLFSRGELRRVRPHPEQAYKSCLSILSFEKKAGRERLINACKRALVLESYSYKIIQSRLEQNFDLIEEDQLQEIDLPQHNNIRGKNYYH